MSELLLFLHIAAHQHQGGVVLENPTILHSTANEVIDKRLDRIRRRHGETVIREFDIDPRLTLEKDKGKGRAQGVGRFVLSEGEEGETDDENDFYRPSPRLGHDVVDSYQSYIPDYEYGYGHGHKQAQDIHGQPQVYGNPHFIGNAYEHHQAVGVVEEGIEGEDSDPDALGDADNQTPAAMFPPRSVQRTIEIEDEMVFEKPITIFDDLDDDDDDHLYRKHVITNTSSVISHEPVSSDSDLALGRYVIVNHGDSFRGTSPPSSRESATSRRLIKNIPLLSGTTHSQGPEKSWTMHSASSSSSSFITPPPSSFQDQGFQQTQNMGPVLSIKKLGRGWFKGKGGQKWEQREYEEVIGSLKLA